MRLIDADALMDDCQLAQKQADRHGREFTSAFYSGGGEISTEWWCVEDMIENARTIEERKWIPCSERLPETDEMMLVTAQPKKGAPNVNRAYYMDGAWHGSGSMSNVIAWMPVPDPYEPEE